ncbi:glutaminyl-peptide cyclotransferase [Candidatus Kapabacteria bacterium]|nr:glutaminyl-peptide cyclotransferase [Candidatus Kapabacteria bacterium]
MISFLACSKNNNQSKLLDDEKPIENKTSEFSFKKGDLRFELINEFPHNANSYTQGLFFLDSVLYESSGGYGKSKLYKFDNKNGSTINDSRLSISIFAEGIELVNNKIYMLTWKSGVCIVHDLEFNQENIFKYEGEGWGICTDNKFIYMSDGSHRIQVRDINSFDLIKRIDVLDKFGMPLTDINELEYVDGEIFANIWLQDRIVRIDPITGEFRGEIDLTPLRKRLVDNPEAEALNGIAFDNQNKYFYLTGKNWNSYFVVKFN